MLGGEIVLDLDSGCLVGLLLFIDLLRFFDLLLWLLDDRLRLDLALLSLRLLLFLLFLLLVCLELLSHLLLDLFLELSFLLFLFGFLLLGLLFLLLLIFGLFLFLMHSELFFELLLLLFERLVLLLELLVGLLARTLFFLDADLGRLLLFPFGALFVGSVGELLNFSLIVLHFLEFLLFLSQISLFLLRQILRLCSIGTVVFFVEGRAGGLHGGTVKEGSGVVGLRCLLDWLGNGGVGGSVS